MTWIHSMTILYKYTEYHWMFPRLKCASPLPALKYCGFSRKVKFCPCQKLLPFVWLLEDRPQKEQKLLVRSCSHTNYYADLSHSIFVNKRLIELWNLIRKSGRLVYSKTSGHHISGDSKSGSNNSKDEHLQFGFQNASLEATRESSPLHWRLVVRCWPQRGLKSSWRYSRGMVERGWEERNFRKIIGCEICDCDGMLMISGLETWKKHFEWVFLKAIPFYIWTYNSWMTNSFAVFRRHDFYCGCQATNIIGIHMPWIHQTFQIYPKCSCWAL